MYLFSSKDINFWAPDELARGPFQGLQGGVLAALMCAELDTIADRRNLGQLASISVQFIKPTPVSELKTEPSVLRSGKRSSILLNKVVSAGETTALATANYIQPTTLSGIEKAELYDLEPEKNKRLPGITSPHGQPWVMDAFDVRPGDNGIVWFKPLNPLVEEASRLSSILVCADWAHGLNRPSEAKVADPNVNLMVSLLRMPINDYVGIQATTQWTESGIGLGNGRIFDQFGHVGNVTMSVVLTPF